MVHIWFANETVGRTFFFSGLGVTKHQDWPQHFNSSGSGLDDLAAQNLPSGGLLDVRMSAESIAQTVPGGGLLRFAETAIGSRAL